jgi:hypothetical protein
MAAFEQTSLVDALERSLRNAKHLRAKDSAVVAAARKLARKIDAWDVIVEWALEDAIASNSRPSVPSNDNVSIASFLKYMETLGLVSPVEESAGAAKATAAAPPAGVLAFRKRAAGG